MSYEGKLTDDFFLEPMERFTRWELSRYANDQLTESTQSIIPKAIDFTARKLPAALPVQFRAAGRRKFSRSLSRQGVRTGDFRRSLKC